MRFILKSLYLFLLTQILLIGIALVMIIGVYVIVFDFSKATGIVTNVFSEDSMWFALRIIEYAMFVMSFILGNAIVEDSAVDGLINLIDR